MMVVVMVMVMVVVMPVIMVPVVVVVVVVPVVVPVVMIFVSVRHHDGVGEESEKSEESEEKRLHDEGRGRERAIEHKPRARAQGEPSSLAHGSCRPTRAAMRRTSPTYRAAKRFCCTR